LQTLIQYNIYRHCFGPTVQVQIVSDKLCIHLQTTVAWHGWEGLTEPVPDALCLFSSGAKLQTRFTFKQKSKVQAKSLCKSLTFRLVRASIRATAQKCVK